MVMEEDSLAVADLGSAPAQMNDLDQLLNDPEVADELRRNVFRLAARLGQPFDDVYGDVLLSITEAWCRRSTTIGCSTHSPLGRLRQLFRFARCQVVRKAGMERKQALVRAQLQEDFEMAGTEFCDPIDHAIPPPQALSQLLAELPPKHRRVAVARLRGTSLDRLAGELGTTRAETLGRCRQAYAALRTGWCD